MVVMRMEVREEGRIFLLQIHPNVREGTRPCPLNFALGET